MELGAAGLQEQPFDNDLRPLTVVGYRSQQEALEFLKQVYEHPSGLGVIRGPELSGKTTIVQHFADTLGSDTAVAIIDGAGLEPNEFLESALSQFGYDLEFDSINELLAMLKVFVQQQAASGNAPLLVVEHMFSTNPKILNVLCDFAKLRVNHKYALRMVLTADRSVQSIIDAPAMECMSSRLTGTYELAPLTEEETRDYVYAKLRAGGCFDPENVFPVETCTALYEASEGWPGAVDQLALAALTKAPHAPVDLEYIDHPKFAKAEEPAEADIVDTPEEEEEEQSSATLVLTKDGKTLKEISLDDSRMMIGRSEHNDLCINSKFISRHHALFVRQGPATFLMDLNSTNGTYVNSRRISNKILINDDVISVGNHGLKFVDPNATDRRKMEGIGFADTAVMRTLRDVRRMLSREDVDAIPSSDFAQLGRSKKKTA